MLIYINYKGFFFFNMSTQKMGGGFELVTSISLDVILVN
jgi:hypothetical protein